MISLNPETRELEEIKMVEQEGAGSHHPPECIKNKSTCGKREQEGGRVSGGMETQ